VQTSLFSNDSAGVVRLVLALGSLAGVIVGGIWKIASSKLTRKNEDLEEEINGFGGRVTEVMASDVRAHTRIDDLVRRADAKDVEVRGVVGDIGRLEAKVDQTLTQGTENKVEIIGEFQRIANEVRSGFHELDVKVERMSATLDERERVKRAM
jgi:hypothetical protein